MSVDILADELIRMEPALTEAEGIENFAEAWTQYFYNAELQLPPAPPAWQVEDDSIETCKAAMVGAMAGVANVAGYAAIQAGITAFWTTLATPPNPTNVFKAVPVISAIAPPPNLSTIAGALAVLPNESDLETAMNNVATISHPLNLGGTATDTTAPTPIVWGIL